MSSETFLRAALVMLCATLVIPLLPDIAWATVAGVTFGVAVMFAAVEVTGE